MIEAKNISKVFRKEPDFAERVAIRLGAAKPPASVHALDNVGLHVEQGEVVGLVGESGCGKSTLGRIMAGMLPASDGAVLWQGQDLSKLSRADRKSMRLAAQIIFQDPMSSLNPRMRVRDIIGEAPKFHGICKAAEMDALVADLLTTVGLDPDMADRFPHQFSGGQRQRIGIARALAVKPDFLICDESIAALDISIQAQILNLLMDLRKRLGLTILFISHDLSVVRHISDRVTIMYLGRVVEEAETDTLFAQPYHPYASALLAEVPRIDRRQRRFTTIQGEIPSPINPPSGCHFHPRCPFAFDRCSTEVPALKQVGRKHRAACHLNDQDDPPHLKHIKKGE